MKMGGLSRLKQWASFVFLFAAASNAWAYQPTPSDIARTDSTIGATRKLGRGVANIGLGWLELFKGIQSVGKENGFWAGATWGPLYGTAQAVRRTAVGVAETLTFPAGGSNNFQPMLEPEFVLGSDSSY